MVNPQGLAVGVYLGFVVVTVDGGPSQSIPVSLIVTSTVATLSPTFLSFSVRGGVTIPSSQTITVSGGEGAVAFSVSPSSTGAWLLVTPSSGILPAVLTVSLAPSGLAPGNYNGIVTITFSG